MPLLPLPLLEASLRRLAQEDRDLVLKHKLIPAAWLPHRTYYAAAAECAYQKAIDDGFKIVARVEPHDYRRAVRKVLGDELLDEACHRLHDTCPELSNKPGAPLWQMSLFSIFLAAIALPGLVLPAPGAAVHMGALACLFFLSVVSLRIMCLLPGAPPPLNVNDDISDDLLPTYTVLVPLYKETRVLGQLVGALLDLDYPSDKLDIKLILEERDTAMQRAVADLMLSSRFDVIVVPTGQPQTKPRALNYALHFARGDLLTIYDAEDIPEPKQLRKAAATFFVSPPDVACLQAELTFFNSSENWISRQFTVEYASLFKVILPNLAGERLPMPLGGTSNHFRRYALERVGAWDPYNVTEDADLGTRLARYGFKSGVVDSFTLEEANIHLISWIKQRSRWLKGFLLTWLVHMRDPAAALRELGPGGFWSFTAMTLGVFLSALLYPAFMLRFAYDLAFMPPPENSVNYNSIILGAGLLLFLSGYFTAFAIGYLGIRERRFPGWFGTLCSMPVYWTLLMPAALLALYESYFKPFHWRKTEHGKSHMNADKARAE